MKGALFSIKGISKREKRLGGGWVGMENIYSASSKIVIYVTTN